MPKSNSTFPVFKHSPYRKQLAHRGGLNWFASETIKIKPQLIFYGTFSKKPKPGL